MCTHEQYINAVAQVVAARLTDEERAKLDGVKLVYGAGCAGLRGVTYYKRWQNGHDEPLPFVEVCAFGERDWVQLAGTTIHELGHVLAEGDGHGKEWKAACARLGLRRVHAAGTNYQLANFAQDVRFALAALDKPTDGEPQTLASMGLGLLKLRPCGAGVGVRGGKSRGAGSGSRLRKCSCGDCGYVARVTSKWIDDVGPPHCPNHGAMVAE